VRVYVCVCVCVCAYIFIYTYSVFYILLLLCRLMPFDPYSTFYTRQCLVFVDLTISPLTPKISGGWITKSGQLENSYRICLYVMASDGSASGSAASTRQTRRGLCV